MSILRPLFDVLLLSMRMHIGARFEGARTIRTRVEIDAGVRGHVLFQADRFLEGLIAHRTLVGSFAVHVSHVIAQCVFVRSDFVA